MTDKSDDLVHGFIECEACAAKLGSPILCKSCLHNRAEIERLQAALERANTRDWPKDEEAAPDLSMEWTSEEVAAIAELAKQQDVSPKVIIRQAVRLYQLHNKRLADGETASYSGDAQRARDFAGPLAATPAPDVGTVEVRGTIGERTVLPGEIIASDVLDEVAARLLAISTRSSYEEGDISELHADAALSRLQKARGK